MSYESKNLSVLAYANGFTLWHYAGSADTVATIMAADYLNDASGMLRVGDMIHLVGSNDGTIVRVTANTGGAVTVQTAIDGTLTEQAAVADLTEGAGALGGTNDGDLPDLSSPDAATNAAAIREVAAKLNALLAAVRAAGVIAA